MILLTKDCYEETYRLYLTNIFFSPLIAAVLLDQQDGVVYVNNLNTPSQVYVEHSFGFAQIFGEPDGNFEQELERYLLVDKCFTANKVRLYAPYTPQFLTKTEHGSFCSYRQRFTINGENCIQDHFSQNESEKKICFCTVNGTNITLIEDKFGVVSRFWRNSSDFILKSNAVVVFYGDEPASICYSAAEANGCMEIDVFTLTEYRNLGLAKLAVIYFVNRCFELSFSPLWDCFINNSGSMMLCKSIGFTALHEPYPFFTINK